MIVIKPLGGLCNRLRVIFSYNEYRKEINEQMLVIWVIDKACNGFFLDYFKPINNVTFYKKNKLKKGFKINYIGFSCHPNYRPNYSDLKLWPHMVNIINHRKKILNFDYIAVHVRRTDHIKMAKNNNKYTPDSSFFNFLNEYKEYNIYIATDNNSTQTKFKNRYKNRVKGIKIINNTKTIRKTSLKDAIIDIYLCKHAKYFMGSGYSSFSDLIKALREYI